MKFTIKRPGARPQTQDIATSIRKSGASSQMEEPAHSLQSSLQELLRYTARFFSKDYMWTPMVRLAPYMWRRRKTYSLLIAMVSLNVLLSFGMARFLQVFTNAATHRNLDMVRSMFAVGILMVILAALSSFFESHLRDVVMSGIEKDVQDDLFAHLLKMKSDRLDIYSSGDLVTRLTYDIHRVGAAVGLHILQILRMVFLAVGAFFYLIQINWQLTLISIGVIPPVAVTILVISRLVRENSMHVAEAMSSLQVLIYEAFRALPVIRVFHLNEDVNDKFQRKTKSILRLQLKNSRLRGIVSASSSMVHFVSFLLCFSFGVYYVARGLITMGDLMAFVTLIQYLVGPMMSAPREFGGHQTAMAATTRIWALLEESPEKAVESLTQSTESAKTLDGNKVTPMSRHLPTVVGVELQDVSFSYSQGSQVLSHVNMVAPAGSTVAIVGPNGAGKSTIFKLLLGFYDVPVGDIHLNGMSVKSMVPAELRRYVTYVPQETVLFTGTVRENIRYGLLESSDESVMEAAIAANAHEFICALPHGYDTVIGDVGLKLSGGQSQRIAIARALLKNAPILLLDEATSALDPESEFVVNQAIERLMTGRTTFIIAHRLSTVWNADSIYVMDQGRVVEVGTHRELVQANGLYARLYEYQVPQTAKSASVR